MTSAKVWLDYDQAELDRQYEQRSLVPNGDDYKAGDRTASEVARRELTCRLDVPYGGNEDEVADLFPAKRPGSPILVFLHGGAWTRGSKGSESFLAPGLVAAGAAVVMVEFTLCPKGSLDNMVQQCRKAVAWVHAHAQDINGDAANIVIAGHSSGSHLAAMLAVTDWTAEGLPADVLKGCIITSGIYDLEPVRRSHRNGYVFLDDAGVERLSPIRHVRATLPPVRVYIGGLELAEFRRQGRDFAAALDAAGVDAAFADLPGLNHFEMGRRLADRNGPVHLAALDLLGLKTRKAA